MIERLITEKTKSVLTQLDDDGQQRFYAEATRGNK
jgi:hypothetical protein